MNTTDSDTQPQYFLALTALEDFWDTSKPILFLGEWCRRYDRKFGWEKFDGEVVGSPWDDKQKTIEAFNYVNILYERLLPKLASALNAIHDVKYSERYWRILIGPWLLYYLPSLYDRFMSLKNALDNYPGFITIGLAEECCVTPRNTLDFVNYIVDDSYNLQLYTKILTSLGNDFPRKILEFEAISIFPEESSFLKKAVKDTLKELTLFFQNSQQVIVKNSYFSHLVEMQLMLKTTGKVWPNRKEMLELPKYRVDLQARSKIHRLLTESCPFEKALNEMLPLDIPQSFLEGFTKIKDETARSYPDKPKAILSANAWYFDEAFKQWSARSAEDDTLLLGVQHGGNYGGLAYMPSEAYEVSITDRYYTWGWDNPYCSSKTVPLPATKLTGRTPLGANNLREGILFVTTSFPRYLIQFPFTDTQFINYLSWQPRFMMSLSKQLQTQIRLRPHYSDFGWSITERLKDCYSDIAIENWDVAFLHSLDNCRLFVCDHFSTTFAEALSADKPSIFFWNPEDNELRTEARPFYDKLREVGILYDNPEDAAAAVSAVYEDIETWWNEPQRQAAVKFFCSKFARTSPDAVNEWAAEFKRIANGVLE
jgi:putative transferase (TIGR04331 family)